MPTATHASFDQLRTWLNEINGEKSAAERGKTTHPSSKVDDGTHKATTGARASENERDVKQTIPGPSVDATKEVGRSQDELQKNIGLHQSATGEDPSVEDNYKDRPKDPGTTSEMSTAIGEKYSFDLSTADGLQKAAQSMGALANQIMAEIAAGMTPEKKAEHTSKEAASSPSSPSPTETSAQAGVSVTSPGTSLDAAQAGYELARLMGLSKEAADATASNVLEGTIRQALYLGDRVGQLLVDLTKRAEEGKLHEEMPGADAGPPEQSAGGHMGGDMPAGLEAAMGGAGGVGPEGGAGPEGAGEPGTDEALQALAQVLVERGIDPKELAALIASHGGGGAGGPGGAPGGMPAPEAPGAMGGPADMGAKIASAVCEFKRAGRYRYREPKTAAEKRLHKEMHNHIDEILKAR